MKPAIFITAFGILLFLGLSGCDTPNISDLGSSLSPKTGTDLVSKPNLDFSRPLPPPEDFVRVIDNPYFPLTPGTIFYYEGVSDGALETDSTVVTYGTQVIVGVLTTVVYDVVYQEGSLIELTFDFYAQDIEGNVWYFGENTTTYDHGQVTGHEGRWRAGEDGAHAGIIMQAAPQVGDTYREELLIGEAQDMATVVSIDETASVPYGTFEHCLRTDNFTSLEPDVLENKVYAPGIGFVKDFTERGGSERHGLVSITHFP